MKSAILVLALPLVALADLSQTVTLSGITTLNLDTGATSASGGDLLWNGTTITPQGKARVARPLPAGTGASAFDSFDATQLKTFSILASAAPIPASGLIVDSLLVIFTNGGNVAKALVTANSGGSITLKFTTYIAATPTGPTIKSVLNNSSRIPAGFPNSGIAPSSLFIIQGSGLADPGDPVLQSSEGAGLQTTLNGASIAVTVSGTTTHPALYYTSPTQLAAVLPAGTSAGTGTITVTYKGVASNAFAIRVVASAPGFSTYNGSGIAQDATTFALLSYTNSGTPGEIIILWGTGLGADPADSDTTYTGTPHTINVPLLVYIGGVQANIVYQGASVYPGVDVIGVVIPQSVPTGCWVPVVAVTGSIISNIVTLPISASAGACADQLTGITGTQIQQPGGLRTGLVSLVQTNSATGTQINSANAAFESYTGLYAPSNSLSPHGCIVTQITADSAPPPLSFTGLDPGVITLTGPNGLAVTLSSQFSIKGAFTAALPAGAIPSTGGTFTFKGSGGADVGSFTSTLTLSNPLLTWTNKSAAASIDMTQGLLVTWTGGNPGTYVFITGTSGNGTVAAGYTCLAPVDDHQFTVPSYILLGMFAGNGATGFQNDIYSPLTAQGLDLGLALADIEYSVKSTYTNGPAK